jgi:hypothetical protein
MEYLESEILKQNRIKVDNAVGYAQWMRLSSEYGAEFDANNPIRRVPIPEGNGRVKVQARIENLELAIKELRHATNISIQRFQMS